MATATRSKAASEPAYEVTLRAAEPRFVALAKAIRAPLVYTAETEFARQALANNDELRKTALAHPQSFADAIVQAAAAGLTLNPHAHEAYLVPRKGKVVLQDDYRGIIKTFVDAGALTSVKVGLVRTGDDFEYYESDSGPHLRHTPALTGERGKVYGGYCRWQLPNGSYEVFYASAEDIDLRRKVSPLGSQNKGPWRDWPDEMQQKTLVRMSSKQWPRRENPRLRALYTIQADAPDDDFEQASDTQVDGAASAAAAEEVTPTINDAQLGELTAMLDKLAKQNPQRPRRELEAAIARDHAIEAIEHLPSDAFARVMGRLADYQAAITEAKAKAAAAAKGKGR